MLVELGVAEQRYRAVLEVLDDDASVTDVARRYGVARQTVHGWLRRYVNDGGLVGLVSRSSRPEACPHEMSAVIEGVFAGQRDNGCHRRPHRGRTPGAGGVRPVCAACPGV